jgi:hypothetical protein
MCERGGNMAKQDGVGQFSSTMFVLFEDGVPLGYEGKVTYWFIHQSEAVTFIDEWQALASRPVSAVPIVGYETQIRLAEELDKHGFSKIALNAIVPGPFVEVDTKDYLHYARKKLDGPSDSAN